jgi:phage FluMu gp28-like protein
MYCPLFEEGTFDITQPLTSQTLNPICPDIDLRRVESVRSKSHDRFRQEYMCEPVDEINAYYPYDMILGCTTVEPQWQPNYEGSYNVLGLDHALVHDRTCAIVNQFKDGVNDIVRVEVTQDDYEKQLDMVARLVRQYKIHKIRPDATSEMGVQVERDLRKRFGYIVEPVKYTNQVKNEMALRLKYLMQNTNNNIRPSINLPNDPELIGEIHGIQIDVTKAGTTTLSGKHGGGLDDMTNALWLSLPPEIIDRMRTAPTVRSDVAPVRRVQPKKIIRNNSKSHSTKRSSIKYRSKQR